MDAAMPGGVEVERHGLQQLAQNTGLVTIVLLPLQAPLLPPKWGSKLQN